MRRAYLTELLATIEERGRMLLSRSWGAYGDIAASKDPVELCRAIISRRGEASGFALSSAFFDRWDALEEAARADLLLTLTEQFGPDLDQLKAAIEAVGEDPSPANLSALHLAAEPKRQELIRRLNQASEGTLRLVRMRETLLKLHRSNPVLEVLDSDFHHLFSSWFNRGFLILKKIDWTTPANILEKIIRYEAVHEINDWDELRERIEPADRRLFAFFHPQMQDEPLIFVEVALTDAIPDRIFPLLAPDRARIDGSQASVAVFYSISNCQAGLQGISFGSFLIKQVAESLKLELPGLKTFVTLSPAPKFAEWVAGLRASEDFSVLPASARQTLALLDDENWHANEASVAELRPVLEELAARYLIRERTPAGRALDPVARFHLGNGARLERLNFLGDRSAKGLSQSHGLMVNYLYDLERIEENHEAYFESGQAAASAPVRKKLRQSRAEAALSLQQ